jgi:catechol 2,3-dioxygenase-like lactoylglutathione lyase family enzyme
MKDEKREVLAPWRAGNIEPSPHAMVGVKTAGVTAMKQRVFPQLRMTDWQRSRAFYVEGLGFTVDWEHRFEPGFPVLAQLTRDGLSLFLSEHAGDCQVGGACYFVVDDVDALAREIRARGVTPDELPCDTPWHTREMNIIDPDGNRLRFANEAKP